MIYKTLLYVFILQKCVSCDSRPSLQHGPSRFRNVESRNNPSIKFENDRELHQVSDGESSNNILLKNFVINLDGKDEDGGIQQFRIQNVINTRSNIPQTVKRIRIHNSRKISSPAELSKYGISKELEVPSTNSLFATFNSQSTNEDSDASSLGYLPPPITREYKNSNQALKSEEFVNDLPQYGQRNSGMPNNGNSPRLDSKQDKNLFIEEVVDELPQYGKHDDVRTDQINTEINSKENRPSNFQTYHLQKTGSNHEQTNQKENIIYSKYENVSQKFNKASQTSSNQQQSFESSQNQILRPDQVVNELDQYGLLNEVVSQKDIGQSQPQSSNTQQQSFASFQRQVLRPDQAVNELSQYGLLDDLVNEQDNELSRSQIRNTQQQSSVTSQNQVFRPNQVVDELSKYGRLNGVVNQQNIGKSQSQSGNTQQESLGSSQNQVLRPDQVVDELSKYGLLDAVLNQEGNGPSQSQNTNTQQQSFGSFQNQVLRPDQVVDELAQYGLLDDVVNRQGNVQTKSRDVNLYSESSGSSQNQVLRPDQVVNELSQYGLLDEFSTTIDSQKGQNQPMPKYLKSNFQSFSTSSNNDSPVFPSYVYVQNSGSSISSESSPFNDELPSSKSSTLPDLPKNIVNTDSQSNSDLQIQLSSSSSSDDPASFLPTYILNIDSESRKKLPLFDGSSDNQDNSYNKGNSSPMTRYKDSSLGSRLQSTSQKSFSSSPGNHAQSMVPHGYPGHVNHSHHGRGIYPCLYFDDFFLNNLLIF